MSPTPSPFDELRVEMFRLYAARDWAGALDLLRDADARLSDPPQVARVVYWRACFLALLGRADDALSTLQGGLARGTWWSSMQLRIDDDLVTLQDEPAFMSILDECERRRLAAQSGIRPARLIVEPSRQDDRPLPLLLALHGYGGNAAETLPTWTSATEAGYLVAALQSSQLAGMDGYHWTDEALTTAEVRQHLAEIAVQYPIDRSRLIIGGFSNGSRLALVLTLATDLHPAAAICVAGGLRTEAFETLDYAALRARTLPRIVAVVGADDRNTSLGEQAERMIAEGLSVELQRVPGLGHAYPADFGERLRAILAHTDQ